MKLFNGGNNVPLSYHVLTRDKILSAPLSKFSRLAHVNVIELCYNQKQPLRGVLKICSKFTGGHPCRSSISIKLQRTPFPEYLWVTASVQYNLVIRLLDIKQEIKNGKTHL